MKKVSISNFNASKYKFKSLIELMLRPEKTKKQFKTCIVGSQNICINLWRSALLPIFRTAGLNPQSYTTRGNILDICPSQTFRNLKERVGALLVTQFAHNKLLKLSKKYKTD